MVDSTILSHGLSHGDQPVLFTVIYTRTGGAKKPKETGLGWEMNVTLLIPSPADGDEHVIDVGIYKIVSQIR